MFAISSSKLSAALLALSGLFYVFSTSGNISAQESFRVGSSAKDNRVGDAGSPAQAPGEDVPQDKDVIAVIKKNKRIDFKKLFPSDWEAVCFSGQYQHPVSDINHKLGKNFSACSGKYKEFRDDGLQAISIIWSHKCRVIEVNTNDFYVESQNGTSCYRKESASDFSLQRWPVGTILAPSE